MNPSRTTWPGTLGSNELFERPWALKFNENSTSTCDLKMKEFLRPHIAMFCYVVAPSCQFRVWDRSIRYYFTKVAQCLARRRNLKKFILKQITSMVWAPTRIVIILVDTMVPCSLKEHRIKKPLVVHGAYLSNWFNLIQIGWFLNLQNMFFSGMMWSNLPFFIFKQLACCYEITDATLTGLAEQLRRMAAPQSPRLVGRSARSFPWPPPRQVDPGTLRMQVAGRRKWRSLGSMMFLFLPWDILEDTRIILCIFIDPEQFIISTCLFQNRNFVTDVCIIVYQVLVWTKWIFIGVGCWEMLQGTMDFTIKYGCFLNKSHQNQHLEFSFCFVTILVLSNSW